MSSKLRNSYLDSAKEETERLLSTPYTWFVQTKDFSVSSRVAGYAQYSLNSPIVQDPANVVYDENGDLIVSQGWNSNYPTALLKIRRPRHGITGGEVEWTLSGINRVFYDKFLRKILAVSSTANTFMIIDPEGNVE